MRKITLNINEQHMNAIEDIFFTEVESKEYKKIRPLLLYVWGQLCTGMKNKDE